MGRKKKGTESQPAREANQTRDLARAALEAGDYRRARELNARVISEAPKTEHAKEAAQELENLKLEPLTVKIGLLSLAVLFLAWLVGLRIFDITL